MLRITSVQTGDIAILRIEGWLDCQYIGELERAWAEATAARKVIVELADVRFVAPAAKALLARMCRAGAEIVARDALGDSVRNDVIAKTGRKK